MVKKSAKTGPNVVLEKNDKKSYWKLDFISYTCIVDAFKTKS